MATKYGYRDGKGRPEWKTGQAPDPAVARRIIESKAQGAGGEWRTETTDEERLYRTFPDAHSPACVGWIVAGR